MVSNLNVPPATLTGGKQTMSSWAKVIKTFAAVPDAYKDSCNTILEDGLPFPYMVLAPAISSTRHKVSEKLLCVVKDVFYVWEFLDGQISLTAYPLKTISAAEVGGILLYSWLTVRGATNDGEPSSTTIAFNTATTRHLLPFINKMRPAPVDTAETEWEAELAGFDYLASVNFKFMNFARSSLVRGEKVIHFVWQPQIRRPMFTQFGRSFHRTKALAHLAILTDKEVILIEDVESKAENRGVRYGGIFQYFPLQHIVAAGITETANDLMTLSLSPAFGGQRLNKIFSASNKQALEEFQSRLDQVSGQTSPQPHSARSARQA